MSKQLMESNEPYFVHIGYTYAHELLKYKRRNGRERLVRRGKLKIRGCVKKRLDKLNKYWGESLK